MPAPSDTLSFETLPFDTLTRSLSGEIHWDESHRRLYANDASIYEILPQAVAFPKNADDCRQLVAFAAQHGLRLTARGAATSLAGQAVGEGIVIDFSRYMNRILSLDLVQGTAIVEPGVVADDLNRVVAEHRLCFPPDPSSKSRCSIGGMIANNAWGAHAPFYGDTADAVIALNVILADASQVEVCALEQASVAEKTQQDNLEGRLYSEVINIVTDLRASEQNQPCADGVPDNMAYALSKIMPDCGAYLNLARLFCGSEGSLGLITQATLSLKPLPKKRYMVCLGFPDVLMALRAVPELIALNPAAIELLDETLLDLARKSGFGKAWIPNAEHKLRAVLIVEYYDLDAEAKSQTHQVMHDMLEHYHATLIEVDRKTIEQVWQTRRNALAQLMRIPGDKKAVSFVEDCAVPVEALFDFTNDVLDILQPLKVECVFYGSVSRGLLHVRPLLDLSDSTDKNNFRTILKAITQLLVKYQGSLSAKHGDGRVRAPMLRERLSPALWQANLDIKACFDPAGIFNRGSAEVESNLLENLRSEAHTREKQRELASLYEPASSFPQGIARCNGAGICLQTDRNSRMCPTYHVRKEEIETTRGRANLLRQAFSGATPNFALVKQALAHCLSCKACQSECPAEVDLTRIKSELYGRYPQLAGTTRQRWMFKHFNSLCRLACRWPKLSNRFMLSNKINRYFSVHPQRPLPQLNRVIFSHWAKKYLRETNPNKQVDVWILNDIYNEYFESAPGIALVNVLQILGLSPGILPGISQLRIQLSNGDLAAANNSLIALFSFLRDQENQNAPIIGIEPSELLSYRDEAAKLLQEQPHFRKYCENQITRFQLVEEFIAAREIRFFNPRLRKVWLHQHCHQKALSDSELCAQSIANVPNIELNMIQTGCCGMAGFYGYHKDTYSMSVDIAKQGLLSNLEEADADDIVLASGFSCRTQIRDLSYQTALHPAEFFATYISVL